MAIDTVIMKFCPHCGIRALIINRDFSLLDSHRRIVHRVRRARPPR